MNAARGKSLALTPEEREQIAKLREDMASVKVQLGDLISKVQGQGWTLYGTQGNGGLNADVHSILVRFATFVETVTDALDRQAVLMVGKDGDMGMVADMSAVKSSLKFWRGVAVALGGLALGLGGDLLRRAIIGS